MPMALVVDAVCDDLCAALSPLPLMGIKFAVMMRVGIDDPLAMLAAVEGSDLLSQMEIEALITTAGMMMDEKEHQPLLAELEAQARELLRQWHKRQN